MKKGVVHKPAKAGNHDDQSDGREQWFGAREPQTQAQPKQYDEGDIAHLLFWPADQEGSFRLAAVQQVVKNVGMPLDTHIGFAALKWRISQVSDCLRRRTHEDNLVLEGLSRCGPAHHIPHRVVWIRSVRS